MKNTHVKVSDSAGHGYKTILNCLVLVSLRTTLFKRVFRCTQRKWENIGKYWFYSIHKKIYCLLENWLKIVWSVRCFLVLKCNTIFFWLHFMMVRTDQHSPIKVQLKTWASTNCEGKKRRPNVDDIRWSFVFMIENNIWNNFVKCFSGWLRGEYWMRCFWLKFFVREIHWSVWDWYTMMKAPHCAMTRCSLHSGSREKLRLWFGALDLSLMK